MESAEKAHAVIILKGAGTLVAEQGQALNINMTGNPGMATGGMGDVLSGLLAGLLAQGMKPFDAARTAVYIHGQAGDEAAYENTEYCLTAGDVIDSLPFERPISQIVNFLKSLHFLLEITSQLYKIPRDIFENIS